MKAESLCVNSSQSGCRLNCLVTRSENRRGQGASVGLNKVGNQTTVILDGCVASIVLVRRLRVWIGQRLVP